MPQVIRVFVGCSAGGEDAESQAVLEYTLRAHASQPVELTWLKVSPNREDVLGGWNTRAWSTPFSGLRWAIPTLCGFEGRAIYLDSDMIVRGDIAELWSQPIPQAAIALVTGHGRKQRTCVMVLDCAAAGRWLPSLKKLKAIADGAFINAELAADPALTGQIEGAWNCVDLKGGLAIDHPAIRLIHYSSIAHQPHLRYAVKRLGRQGRKHWYDGQRFDHWRPELTALFDRLLAEAAADGFSPERYEPTRPYAPQIKSYRGVRVKGFSA